MHYYINRRVKYVLDGYSMLSGMLFQLNWNPVPTYLEQGYILAGTKRELKKLTTRAYWVGNERWRLEVGKSESLVVTGYGMNGLDSAKLVSNVTRVRDKRTRYANYRVVVGPVVAISLSTFFVQKVLYLIPKSRYCASHWRGKCT